MVIAEADDLRVLSAVEDADVIHGRLLPVATRE
jgi:hypothetical protein